MKSLRVSASICVISFTTALMIFGLLSLRGLPVRGGGGAPAGATMNGDVNCDGKVDIADAVSLIQWQFTGGAPPCALAQDNFATRDDLGALASRVAALEGANKHDAKVATGVYTGDGTTNRILQTGLSGRIRSLSVSGGSHLGTFAATITDQTPLQGILLLDGANFIIPGSDGSPGQLNFSGLRYAWIAFSTQD
jgi:hypothetical protein